MKVLKAIIGYYSLALNLEFDTGLAVEMILSDDYNRDLAKITREAKRVGRAAWPKKADRMSVHVVLETHDHQTVYAEHGIKQRTGGSK